MTEERRASLADRGPARADVQAGYVELALQHGFRPQSFWTLTFDERRTGKISAERALAAWRWFVRVLNEMAHGKHYRQWCKHSAFSYIAAVDHSELGAVHLHAVVDGWVDFREAYRVWNAAYGAPHATVISVGEDERVAIAHVVKYATKGSDRLAFWFRDRAPERTSSTVVLGPQRTPGGACQAQAVLPGFSLTHRAPDVGPGVEGEGLTGSGVR